jgi:hypothetical protein
MKHDQEAAMNTDDLDLAYTTLCRTMTTLGESNSTLFLARFAMLAITRLGNAASALELIAAAADIDENAGRGGLE